MKNKGLFYSFLIIYPKLEPLCNTELEKFLEAFIIKNQTAYFQLAFVTNILFVLISNSRLSLKSHK